MKNKFLIIVLFFYFQQVLADQINIKASKINIDKKNEITIFENNVVIKDEKNNIIESDYAEYDRVKKIIKLKNNVKAVDIKNNVFESYSATYDEKQKTIISDGDTKIITSEGYLVEGKNIKLNNNQFLIASNYKTIITDIENNKIYLDNFEYDGQKNIFKSVGKIEIIDKENNSYKFSQIYIDEKKHEIIGTDIKANLNSEIFRSNPKNKPRVFANSFQFKDGDTKFNKSIFTVCDYRKDEKCPPWTLQASEMIHDKKKKTIYYDNAVVKIYDIPIFYFPKLMHPDPSVDRRSGFLVPSFSDTKNLGSKLTVPFFWDIGKNRDLTLTSNFYGSEHPLYLGEYRHAFRNSNLILDFGYTQGYKKTSVTKKSGDKSHFFSQFVKNFDGKKNSKNSLQIVTQNTSNDKYLKLYKIKSNLVDNETEVLENSLSLSHENDNFFLGLDISSYETLKSGFNDKYEYIFPDITFDKNLMSNDIFGNLDLQSNFKVHNYDTNKTTKFLINDFDWKFREIFLNSGINSKILGKFKNINYDAKNVEDLRVDTTNEFHGAVGVLSEIKLFKQISEFHKQFLKPKLLVRYAPGNMRKESSDARLTPDDAFLLDRLNNPNNFENGLSASFGLDYEINAKDKNFYLNMAQVLNEKENKKMPNASSLNSKLSDLVVNSRIDFNTKLNFDYNFSLDHNYKDFNYNEFGANINLNPIKFDFSYLQENKHIGDQEYFKAKMDISRNENGIFSFETKRNLITNSSEFYNLSYEYMNDCLRAGLVYRREFYDDSELESENSLMFKITIVPFGEIDTPSFKN